jgi:hypothetical protein
VWQSAAAAVLIGILALALRRNPARIRHWLWKQGARSLDFSRKLLLCVAGTLDVAGPVAFGLLQVVEARAQAQQDLSGSW